MDPALLLLLRLRFWGWLRRAGRKLATARGLLLTAVGLSIFLPSIVAVLLDPKPRNPLQMIDGFRRFGPAFLLIYCLITLLFSPGDKAFAFTPAEIGFLFPAPFSRRKLLAYKIAGNLGLTCLTGLFMTFVFRQFMAVWIFGYVGLVLAFSFLTLFAMAVTLAGQAIGARASTWRRRLALALIVAVVGGTALTAGRDAIGDIPDAKAAFEAIKRLETAPALRVALAPFRPFIMTISARHLWPDFVSWAAAALAVDALLVGAILALDAQYLEAAAVSSEQLYAKIERMRKGGPGITRKPRKRPWKEVPALPWWGGAGPVFWRQLTAAGRDYARVLAPFLFCGGLAALAIYLAGLTANPDTGVDPAFALGFGLGILLLSIVVTPLLGFDFRGDFERMEGLKTLPLRPSTLALGQLATPWLVMSVAQLLALMILAVGTWPVPPLYWAFAAFVPVLNLVLLEIDNVMFLWFPSRPMAHTPGDFQAMGRHMIFFMAKFLVLGVALGAALGLGALAYLVGGWIAALVMGWLVLLGLAILCLPLIASAFTRFDVAFEAAA